MPLSINTNVASLTAQRAMLNSNSALETSFERLSTGKRVNSAVDDAAGLAIGKDLESRVSGLNQAIRNVNDGISMVQIAEGAMDEATTILQRMRDLAVQAANGSMSTVEQGYLDAEQAKLAETLGKVIDQSQFNGTDLVSDSAATNIVIQSGADSSDTTSLSFAKMTELSLGVDAAAIDLSGNTTKVQSASFENFLGTGGSKAALSMAGATAKLASGGTGNYVVTLDGNTFTTGSITAPTSLADLATALNAIDGVSDLGTFAVDGSVVTTLDFDAKAGGKFTIGATNKIHSEGFDTNFNSGAAQNFAGTAGADYTAHAGGDESYTLQVGTRAAITVVDTGSLAITNKALATIINNQAIADGITDFTVATAGGYDNSAITLTYNSATGNVSESTYSLTKTANSGAAAVADDTTGDLTNISVSSANDAIATIDAALAAVASERATLGATQSQLESTVRNLANVAENTSAAAGRIMDTDYAAETANLTKAQILQQAATSILAQANAQPQSVLSLLQ